MANQTKVLFDELLRSRIVGVEYKGLDKHAIKRMYMEEKGEVLDIPIMFYRCIQTASG